MNIKHWAGYGVVEATKVSKKTAKNGMVTLVVMVKGNHERGLERGLWDEYLLYEWLVKRFDRKAQYGNHMFQRIHADDDCSKSVETCEYTFVYNPNGKPYWDLTGLF